MGRLQGPRIFKSIILYLNPSSRILLCSEGVLDTVKLALITPPNLGDVNYLSLT